MSKKIKVEPTTHIPDYIEIPSGMFGAIHEAEAIVKDIATKYPGGVMKNEGSGGIVDFWYDKKIKFGDCVISISVAVGVYDKDDQASVDD